MLIAPSASRASEAGSGTADADTRELASSEPSGATPEYPKFADRMAKSNEFTLPSKFRSPPSQTAPDVVPKWLAITLKSIALTLPSQFTSPPCGTKAVNCDEGMSVTFSLKPFCGIGDPLP